MAEVYILVEERKVLNNIFNMAMRYYLKMKKFNKNIQKILYICYYEQCIHKIYKYIYFFHNCHNYFMAFTVIFEISVMISGTIFL